MVIPPHDIDIEQERYRELMDLRRRIEGREIALEPLGEEAFDLEDGEIPDRSRHAFVEALKARFFTADLPARHDEVVSDAIGTLADEEWATAEALLREAYTSVCEEVNPGLGAGAHPVACHLFGPEQIGLERPEASMD